MTIEPRYVADHYRGGLMPAPVASFLRADITEILRRLFDGPDTEIAGEAIAVLQALRAEGLVFEARQRDSASGTAEHPAAEIGACSERELTTAEVADRMGVDPRTVRVWREKGRLPGRWHARQWWFSQHDVDNLEGARRGNRSA